MKKRYIAAVILAIAVFIVIINLKDVREVKDATVYAKQKAQEFFVKEDKKWENNEEPSKKVHLRSVKPDIPLDEILKGKNIDNKDGFNIFIDLDKRTLYFKYNEEILKQYVISAGKKTDEGKKETEGDYKTPVGNFYICGKEVYNPPKTYLGSRWMMLSYPGLEAAEEGLEKGMISQEQYNLIKKSYQDKTIPPQTTKLGSYIGIHGGAIPDYPKDWTAGCIGMYNQDIEEIYAYVENGTKVVIR
ncbi:MAG TPA: L,D-transpeptidase [Pseudobacteroides sp.]|nr:L,D-transpeptidase [Pseudobacteroides sp.]